MALAGQRAGPHAGSPGAAGAAGACGRRLPGAGGRVQILRADGGQQDGRRQLCDRRRLLHVPRALPVPRRRRHAGRAADPGRPGQVRPDFPEGGRDLPQGGDGHDPGRGRRRLHPGRHQPGLRRPGLVLCADGVGDPAVEERRRLAGGDRHRRPASRRAARYAAAGQQHRRRPERRRCARLAGAGNRTRPHRSLAAERPAADDPAAVFPARPGPRVHTLRAANGADPVVDHRRRKRAESRRPRAQLHAVRQLLARDGDRVHRAWRGRRPDRRRLGGQPAESVDAVGLRAADGGAVTVDVRLL